MSEMTQATAAEQAQERQPILSIRHLSKDFKLRGEGLFDKPKTLHALSDVSLDVYEGETLGIIGESGCGKSTLGRCVVQLHQATSGEIRYKGQDINGLKGPELKAMRKNIQMVFQDSYSSLDPRFTAARAIEEPLRIYNLVPDKAEREKIVFDLMKEVGLDIQHMERFPHEFSGGQRQRINVARALVLDPKIIVCDEPVSALDVSIQAQVLNLFRRLQRDRGLTYLFISHDLSVIKHISDRIAIMYLGRVVELCPAHRVYENPMHPYTQALLSAVPPESPFQKTEELKLKGEIASPVGDQVGCPLAGRCPFCEERCRKERPALTEVEPGHQVACFRYHDAVTA
ncbi:ABC transporter ATP-binding protein [Enorma phocaeensis]|uniref:ATP-binding cassette domain-containing protein n=1 Tax=Enorma phocaeensis TaxID=1871019 RepID=A0A921ITJ2_9ACTN|nr:oligopeptide/dipeptide ABC transporter ATP-binding protein [Enorma phocaeensis]HJG36823.1 ATP-binding cassette domain-containing protein [Enorma phocaeensis]